MKTDPFSDTISYLEKVEKYIRPNLRKYFNKLKTPDHIHRKEIEIKMDNGEKKKFKAFRVQHNNVLGPYKGGIRFHSQVTESEVKALALWMSLKCAVAGLPLGGGKGGVVVDPKSLSKKELERLSRAYAKAFASVIGERVDVPAPDVNTNPQIMAWMIDEYIKYQISKIKNTNQKSKINKKPINQWRGTFTGKPIEAGGTLGRTKATGFGGVIILRALLAKLNSKFNPVIRQVAASNDSGKIPACQRLALAGRQNSKLTVVVQGFGNVGYYFAKTAAEEGFNVVAVSDSKGGIIKSSKLQTKNQKEKNNQQLFPLDIPLVMDCKKEKGTLAGCYCSGGVCNLSGGQMITNEELLEMPVDILVPAALEGVINEKNADKIKAKIVIEMANGPVTAEADEILTKKGIVVIPDILANSGGVSVSYFEWLQNLKGERWSENKVDQKLQELLERSFAKVWEKYRQMKEKMKIKEASLRLSAYVIAIERILGKACKIGN